MSESVREDEAREWILRSIREHLAASAPHDALRAEEQAAHHVADQRADGRRGDGGRGGVERVSSGHELGTVSAAENSASREGDESSSLTPVEIFRASLEAVGGHCVVVRDESEAARELSRIVRDLQATPLCARRIALSDAPIVARLMRRAEVEVEEIATAPGAEELFGYDVGVTSAQGAIAETGTLVLESERERHRLVSLLPPAHVAIIRAADIRLTLGEALSPLRRGGDEALSRTITFVTGPSRTADIELTLAIGVHGPQELYVIVIADDQG